MLIQAMAQHLLNSILLKEQLKLIQLRFVLLIYLLHILAVANVLYYRLDSRWHERSSELGITLQSH